MTIGDFSRYASPDLIRHGATQAELLRQALGDKSKRTFSGAELLASDKVLRDHAFTELCAIRTEARNRGVDILQTLEEMLGQDMTELLHKKLQAVEKLPFPS